MTAALQELHLMPEVDALKADASTGSKPGAQAPHWGFWTMLPVVANVSPEVLHGTSQHLGACFVLQWCLGFRLRVQVA